MMEREDQVNVFELYIISSLHRIWIMMKSKHYNVFQQALFSYIHI